MDAETLIGQSIATTSIAHATYSPSLADTLATCAEDWTDSGDAVEYWGTRAGLEWRVHLDRP